MESRPHATLKLWAVWFLLRNGCRAAAREVRCPGSRYVLDAAGYLDALPKRATTLPPQPTQPPPLFHRSDRPRTIIVECKQSRSDFLRDAARTDDLVAQRDRLAAECRRLEEERIKVHEPQLRISGTSLFPDMETWDFTASRLATYRRLRAALRRVDEQMYGHTKLWLITAHRLADYRFLAAPAGLIRRRELPAGWGLLECSARDLGRAPGGDLPPVEFRVSHPCDEAVPRDSHVHRMLRNIAVAATRDSLDTARRAPVGAGRGLWSSVR